MVQKKAIKFVLVQGVLVCDGECLGSGRYEGMYTADAVTLALREASGNPNATAPGGWR